MSEVVSQFEALCGPIATAMLLVDQNALVLAVNSEASKLLLTADPLCGTLLADWVADPEDLKKYLGQCARSRQPIPGGLSWVGRRTIDPDASDLAIHCNGFLVRPRAEEVPAVISLTCRRRTEAVGRFVALEEKIEQRGLEIKARQAVEQQLRRSYDLLRSVVEGTSDQIWVKTEDGRIELINSAAAKVMKSGKEETVLHAPLDEADQRVISTGRVDSFEESKIIDEAVHVFHTAKFPYRNTSGVVIGVVTIARDISQLRGLELQLWQAQKMEAIGRLAGGIAHDFNNLMTVVTGYSTVILDRLSETDPLREDIQDILDAGERAAALTRQLLAFSRKQIFQAAEVDVNEIVGGMERMLRHLLGEKVQLQTTMHPDAGHVKVDRSQMEQVVMNLAINGRDAMPSGGRLIIETAAVELDAVYCSNHPDVEPGQYAMISVIDEGIGMDQHLRPRIFEPFFTTKPKGTGTGLGLATVHGIVRQSGGHIRVHSELGLGSTFKVYLPWIRSSGAESSPPTTKVALPRTRGTILVVEDEPGVRKLTCRLLRDLGYRVLDAADGQAALDILQKDQTIDMLLVDVVMPGLDGPKVADKARSLRSDLVILFMSGYTEDAVVHHGLLDSDKAFIAKPFTAKALDAKLTALLASQASAKSSAR